MTGTSNSILQYKLDDAAVRRLGRRSRRKPLVLYLGRAYFGDNSKYLYLEHLRSVGDIEALWCTESESLAAQLEGEGLPVLKILDDPTRTLEVFLSAAAVVMCESPVLTLQASRKFMAALSGAYRYQLWHGISVKHLLFDLVEHLGISNPGFLASLEFASQCDVTLSTHERFDLYWRRTFGCSSLIRVNHPRNVVLTRSARAQELIGATFPEPVMRSLESDRVKVLVAPTWQRSKFCYTMTREFLEECLRFSGRHGVEFYYKGHPMVDGGPSESLTARFHFLNSEVDIYPHLPKMDVLVTDYSSIMFDFLYVDRPILRLDVDAEGGHQSYEPDFSLVPDEDFAYKYTSENLSNVLAEALDCDAQSEGRRRMRDAIFATAPEDAAPRLLQDMAEQVDRIVNPTFSVR